VIALDDHGFRFGDGVYDAWGVLDSRHFLRTDHLERLERSCAALGIEPCYGLTELGAFSDLLLAEPGLQRAMVGFQRAPGRQLPRSPMTVPTLQPIVSGFIKDFADNPEMGYAMGCKLILHPDERQLIAANKGSGLY
jgi:D-alanine transaminase